MIALCESVRTGQPVQETMKGVLTATTPLSQNGLLEAFQKEIDRAQATEGLSNELRQKLTEEKIEALLQTGLDQKNIAKNLELRPATVSRYCKKNQGEK